MAKMNHEKLNRSRGHVTQKPSTHRQDELIRRLAKEQGIKPPKARNKLHATEIIENLMRKNLPTESQISYLKSLCRELEETYSPPATRQDATKMIGLLVYKKDQGQAQVKVVHKEPTVTETEKRKTGKAGSFNWATARRLKGK